MLAPRSRAKVTCSKCKTYDVPDFEGKCLRCAARLDPDQIQRSRGVLVNDDEGQKNCGACQTQLVENDKYCTGCGAQVLSEADDANGGGGTACTQCGAECQPGATSCPRCGASCGGGGDQGGNGDEKKTLLDRQQAESWETAQRIPPAEEAAALVAMAGKLDESQIEALAAHIVWGERDQDRPVKSLQQLAAEPPAWLAEEYWGQWEDMVKTWRPKTIMSAVHTMKGLVGSMTQQAAA